MLWCLGHSLGKQETDNKPPWTEDGDEPISPIWGAIKLEKEQLLAAYGRDCPMCIGSGHIIGRVRCNLGVFCQKLEATVFKNSNFWNYDFVMRHHNST